MLERLIETLQRAVESFGDGLADRRSHERIKDADEVAGIFADRCLGRPLESRRQDLGEMFVPGIRKGERACQHGADGFGELLRIIELLLQSRRGQSDPARGSRCAMLPAADPLRALGSTAAMS